MGKKLLVGKYTFDASENKIVLKDNIATERLLLITDVTINKFIYNFADPTLGIVSRTYDGIAKETTFILDADCVTLGCADTDSIQVFIDQEAVEFAPGASYVDPVSKIRVSNPENLIDTDFEYGLQSTKWETLELTNNIPTFFSRDGDADIILTSVNVQAGSDIVTVTCGESHGLQRGSPIVMQSTGAVSADGGFIVAGVIDDFNFNFKGKSEFTITDDIKETYTQLFPAKIYTGTEFKLNQIGGITTDGATPTSTLTVNTVAPSNFTSGTSMALSNTFAKATVEFNTDNVDDVNTISYSQDTTSNVATGETDKFMLGGVSAEGFVLKEGSNAPFQLYKVPLYFEEGVDYTVNTSTNTIVFNQAHGLSNSFYNTTEYATPFVYMGDSGTNSPIGGLSYWTSYWYYVRSATEITIHYRRVNQGQTSYKMNLTGAGTSGGIVKSAICPSKLIYYYRGRYGYYYYLDTPEYAYGGNPVYGGYASSANQRVGATRMIQTDGTGTTNTYYFYHSDDMFDLHSTTYDHYVYHYFNNRIRMGYNAGSTNYGYWSTSGDSAMFDLDNDNKRSSLYTANHGLTAADNGTNVTVTALTGTLPSGLSSGSSYGAVYVTDNRLALNSTTGSQINFYSYGSTNLEYRIAYTKANPDANTIEIPANTLNEGDAITYTVGAGNTALGGLVDGTTYYVCFKVGDKFKLSTQKNVFGPNKILTNTSSYYTNYTTDIIRIPGGHGFNTGDAIQYVSASPLPGLVSNQVYWIRDLSTDEFALYNSQIDANNNTNRVDFTYTSSGTSIYTRVYVVDITSVPVGETHSFAADFVGAADGLYDVGTTANDQLSFTLPATTQIEARTVSVTAQTCFAPAFDALFITNHGFITGDSFTYTTSGDVNISGLSSGVVYYAVRVSKDMLRFASTQANAELGTYITLSEDSAAAGPFLGTVTLQPTTIVGSFNGTGTVSFTGGGYRIDGTSTNFTSYFNKGDQFFVNQPSDIASTVITNRSTNTFTAAGHTIVDGDMITFTGDALPGGITAGYVYYGRSVTSDTFTAHYTAQDAIGNTSPVSLSSYGTNASVNRYITVGGLVERTIDYVNSDTQLTVTEPLPSTSLSDVNYLQNTSLLLRPDGFALHRPYDGGVELIPSTNPDSTMIRQTRKYFRYQSGKGIQVSFAVNFSPTSQIDTFTRSGSTGTITTRFPHRLSTGLRIVTSGSTNSANDAWGTINIDVSVAADENQNNKYYINGSLHSTYTLYEGRTYKFDQSDVSNTGHPLRFSTTENGTHGGGTEYTTGVTVSGTPGSSGAYTQITVPVGGPDLYVYCTAHSGMGLSTPTPTDPTPTTNLWNDEIEVTGIVDDFTATVAFNGTPVDQAATGVVEYYVKNWQNSKLKCGLFDDQNGIFFEFDGQELHCCRRSAIRQISGYANVTFRQSTITGINTKFASQLQQGDNIVVKGQTYKISKIDSDTQMHVIPSYRGTSQEKVVITKIETTAVAQRDWNLDVCDGTGYTGFILNPYKIQMAYIDYSWYGAGKVRFGFKDQNGDVQYVHSFTHGNEFTEAYMRSGNVPARYEIENIGQPSYVPALAHWGTSVIMDGRFDPDKAYIFNAPSKNITLTGVSQLSTSARVEYTGNWRGWTGRNYRDLGYALTLETGDSSLNQFSAGLDVGGANLDANTKLDNPDSNQLGSQPYVPDIYCYNESAGFGSGGYRNMLVIDRQPTGSSGSFSSYTLGAASGGEINVTKDVPLISIRLAPSVDTSAPGFLGEREIVNRMQLILQGVNILSTHAVNVKLILNGQLSSNAWERVTPPSLSQLIFHNNVDTISGGASVFNFDAQGGTGTSRTPVLTTESLGDIATLGNSILGGDNVYPDGPDVLTLVATLAEDPSEVTGTTPFIVSGRVSWSESQA